MPNLSCIIVIYKYLTHKFNLFVLKYTDRTIPVDRHLQTMLETHELTSAPINPQMFGNAGREHMEKYGQRFQNLHKVL